MNTAIYARVSSDRQDVDLMPIPSDGVIFWTAHAELAEGFWHIRQNWNELVLALVRKFVRCESTQPRMAIPSFGSLWMRLKAAGPPTVPSSRK